MDIETEILYDYMNEVELWDEENEYIEYPIPSNESFKLYHLNNARNETTPTAANWPKEWARCKPNYLRE